MVVVGRGRLGGVRVERREDRSEGRGTGVYRERPREPASLLRSPPCRLLHLPRAAAAPGGPPQLSHVSVWSLPCPAESPGRAGGAGSAPVQARCRPRRRRGALHPRRPGPLVVRRAAATALVAWRRAPHPVPRTARRCAARWGGGGGTRGGWTPPWAPSPSPRPGSPVSMRSPVVPLDLDLSSPLTYGTPSSRVEGTPRSGVRGTPLRQRPDLGSARKGLQVDLHSDGVSPGPVGARWGARCGRSLEPAPVGFSCAACRRRYSGERAVFGPKTRDLGNRCKRGNVQRKLSGEVSFLQASKMWEQVCMTYVQVPQCLGTDAYVGENHRYSF